MSDKKQVYHVAIVERDNKLKVTWVRRAGTHKAMMPCDTPEHVTQYLGCDNEGWIDDLTLDELRADKSNFEPFKLNDDPHGIAGIIRVETPDPVYDWDQDYSLTPYMEKVLRRAQQELRAIENLKHPVPTVDAFFDTAPEGDFKWEAPDYCDPGDVRPSYCDDCESWHGYHYTNEMGRKDGKRYVTTFDIDNDGDKDVCSCWEDGFGEQDWECVMDDMDTNHVFRQQAEYDLWCAETGKDPLDNWMFRTIKTKHDWFRRCIASAQSHMKYLLMGHEGHVATYKGAEIEIEKDEDGCSVRVMKAKPGKELDPFVSDWYTAKDGYDALQHACTLVNKYCR